MAIQKIGTQAVSHNGHLGIEVFAILSIVLLLIWLIMVCLCMSLLSKCR